MAVQKSENNQRKVFVRFLEVGSRIVDHARDARIVIRMLRMKLLPQAGDRRINLNRVNLPVCVAKRGRDVVSGAGSNHQDRPRRQCRRVGIRKIVERSPGFEERGILLSLMQVQDHLVIVVVHLDGVAGLFPKRHKLLRLVIEDLLQRLHANAVIGRPDKVVGKRNDEKENERAATGGNQIAAQVALHHQNQQNKSAKKPDRRRSAQVCEEREQNHADDAAADFERIGRRAGSCLNNPPIHCPKIRKTPATEQ